MAHSISSSTDSAGTGFMKVLHSRARTVAGELYDQTHLLQVDLYEVLDGAGTILDTVLVNTTRWPAPVATDPKLIRWHWAYWDTPSRDRIVGSYNGVILVELDTSAFSGTKTKVVGFAVDGNSDGTTKPARAALARVVKLPSAGTQAPNTGRSDVVVFVRGQVWSGTLGSDRTLGQLSISLTDPPTSGVPGLLGPYVQAVSKIITRNDETGTAVTRTRILAVDGENEADSSQVIIDTVNQRVYRWDLSGVGASEVRGARLLDTLWDRVFWAGRKNNPSLWGCSKVGDHLDYDPAGTNPDRAFIGTDGRVGKPADAIQAMFPVWGQYMLMGCAKSLYVLDGDPGFGGQVRRVSDSTGIIGPRAYCFDDAGHLYFVGPGGLYAMARGTLQFTNVSNRYLASILDQIDTSDTDAGLLVQCAFDLSTSRVHVFLTPRGGLTAGVHAVYDTKDKAFWLDEYPAAFGPFAVAELTGTTDDDRRFILVGDDGFVRRPNSTSRSDDGDPIRAWVSMAALQLADGERESKVVYVAGVGSPGSGPVECRWRVGESPVEVAGLDLGTYATSWSWFTRRSGRQEAVNPNERGAAHQLIIFQESASETFALEHVLAKLKDVGPVRTAEGLDPSEDDF